jgi:hypothetical protein
MTKHDKRPTDPTHGGKIWDDKAPKPKRGQGIKDSRSTSILKRKALQKLSAVPKRKTEPQASWNYRVVRRYHESKGRVGTTWLEITEVHYRKGKPTAFVIGLGAPQVTTFGILTNIEDVKALADLRETINLMQTALSQPILDEIKDFKGEHSE